MANPIKPPRRLAKTGNQLTRSTAAGNLERLGRFNPGMLLVQGIARDGARAVQVACVTHSEPKLAKGRLLLHEDRSGVALFSAPKAFPDPTPFSVMTIVDKWLFNGQHVSEHLMGSGGHVLTIAQYKRKEVQLRAGSVGLWTMLSNFKAHEDEASSPRLTDILTVGGEPAWQYDASRLYTPTGFNSRDRILTQDDLSAVVEPGVGLATEQYPPSLTLDEQHRQYALPLGNDAKTTAKFYWDNLDRDSRVAVVAKTITANGFVDYYIQQMSFSKP